MGTIRKKIIQFLLILVFSAQAPLFAQQITYLAPFEMDTENEDAFQLIGKINQKFLLYHHAPGHEAELICFNDSGYIEKFLSLPQIKNNSTRNIGMIGRKDRFTLLTQHAENGKLYAGITHYNETGPISETSIIDSVRLDIYGRQGIFNIVNSPQKKYTLLYRILAGFSASQIKIETIRLDSLGHFTDATGFYINFQADLDMFSPPVISDEGEYYWPVYDKPYNYKLGTTLRIFQMALNSKTPLSSEVYLKENKPVEIQVRPLPEKKTLAFGGLYSNFYKKGLEGAFYGFVRMGAKKADSLCWMPMDKKFKRDLKSGVYSIPFDDVINSIQLRQFQVYPNGTVTVLADMFNNFTGLRLSGFNNQSNLTRNRFNSPANTGVTNPVSALTNTQQSGSNTSTRTIANDRASSPNPDMGTRGGGSLRRNTSRLTESGVPAVQQNAAAGLDAPFQPMAPAYMPEAITPKNAGNVLMRNKTMDYKTVVFTAGANGMQWKNWTKNLYVPETPFANILQLPDSSGKWQLINYEINQKNVPYLRNIILENIEKPVAQKLDKPGKPFLFYKSNALLIGQQEILTLYVDPETQQAGLAIIKW